MFVFKRSYRLFILRYLRYEAERKSAIKSVDFIFPHTYNRIISTLSIFINTSDQSSLIRRIKINYIFLRKLQLSDTTKTDVIKIFINFGLKLIF